MLLIARSHSSSFIACAILWSFARISCFEPEHPFAFLLSHLSQACSRWKSQMKTSESEIRCKSFTTIFLGYHNTSFEGALYGWCNFSARMNLNANQWKDFLMEMANHRNRVFFKKINILDKEDLKPFETMQFAVCKKIGRSWLLMTYTALTTPLQLR